MLIITIHFLLTHILTALLCSAIPVKAASISIEDCISYDKHYTSIPFVDGTWDAVEHTIHGGSNNSKKSPCHNNVVQISQIGSLLLIVELGTLDRDATIYSDNKYHIHIGCVHGDEITILRYDFGHNNGMLSKMKLRLVYKNIQEKICRIPSSIVTKGGKGDIRFIDGENIYKLSRRTTTGGFDAQEYCEVAESFRNRIGENEGCKRRNKTLTIESCIQGGEDKSFDLNGVWKLDTLDDGSARGMKYLRIFQEKRLIIVTWNAIVGDTYPMAGMAFKLMCQHGNIIEDMYDISYSVPLPLIIKSKYMYPACLEQWKYREEENGEVLEEIGVRDVIKCETIQRKCTKANKGRIFIRIDK